MSYAIRVLSLVSLMLLSPLATAAVESWYTYWGIGMSRHQYPEPLQSDFDYFDSIPGIDRTQISIDILGFYFPADNQRTIRGVVISGSSDTLDDGSYRLRFNQYLYAFSAMHFFGNEPGDGWFLRSDIGFARIIVSDSDGYSENSDWGQGVLLGGGYGLPISSETRLLFTAGVAHNRIEGDAYQTFVLTLGGLF